MVPTLRILSLWDPSILTRNKARSGLHWVYRSRARSQVIAEVLAKIGNNRWRGHIAVDVIGAGPAILHEYVIGAGPAILQFYQSSIFVKSLRRNSRNFPATCGGRLVGELQNRKHGTVRVRFAAQFKKFPATCGGRLVGEFQNRRPGTVPLLRMTLKGVPERDLFKCQYFLPDPSSASVSAAPSSLTTLPSLVRLLKIVPVIVPKASTAPIVIVEGIISRITATNSTAPEPNRPHGSSPTVEKIYYDSSAPVNLKNNV